MKPKQILRIAVDFAMAALLPVMMAYMLVGRQTHEWLGAAMLALFLLHHALNYRWFTGLCKGRWTAYRSLQALLDFALLAAMLALAASGVVMSRYVFAFLPARGGMGFARIAHMLAAYWGFIAMAAHLGLHGAALIGLARRITGIRPCKARTAALRLLAVALAGCGAFAFGKHRLADYLFLRIQFVFFDYGQPPLQFFAEYLAMICLFALAAYYLGMVLQAQRHAKGKKEAEP